MFNKVKQKDTIDFSRILSLMLLSGIPLLQAIELIIQQNPNVHFTSVLKKVSTDLKSGKSLSVSLSKHPEIFPEIYTANIRIGEETGNVAEILADHTDFIEKIEDIKKKVSQASRYPLFVISVSLLVMAFMLFFLIPSFESLFTSAGAELPELTAFLLEISRFCVDNGIYIFIIILLLGWGTWKLYNSTPFRRNYLDKLLLRLPIVSGIYKSSILARFSLSMAVMLKGGVRLPDALKAASNISDNGIFREEIDKRIKSLTKGKPLASSAGGFFDPAFSGMIAAGEESAGLEKVFELLGRHYTKEFDNSLQNIISFLEPALILFVGIIVAVILVGMYLPLFELVNYIGS